MTERTAAVLDARSLRALAHPLRIRLLGLLRADGPATATGLAARVGESSGTTSYHLRRLADAGLVAEDPARGNARERWWLAAQDATRLDPTDVLAVDPTVRPALDVYLGAVAASYAARVRTFLDEADTWPVRWRRAADLSDYQLSLTATELRRLNEHIEQVVESYRRPPRRGDEQVIVQTQSFPRRRGAP